MNNNNIVHNTQVNALTADAGWPPGEGSKSWHAKFLQPHVDVALLSASEKECTQYTPCATRLKNFMMHVCKERRHQMPCLSCPIKFPIRVTHPTNKICTKCCIGYAAGHFAQAEHRRATLCPRFCQHFLLTSVTSDKTFNKSWSRSKVVE